MKHPDIAARVRAIEKQQQLIEETEAAKAQRGVAGEPLPDSSPLARYVRLQLGGVRHG